MILTALSCSFDEPTENTLHYRRFPDSCPFAYSGRGGWICLRHGKCPRTTGSSCYRNAGPIGSAVGSHRCGRGHSQANVYAPANVYTSANGHPPDSAGNAACYHTNNDVSYAHAHDGTRRIDNPPPDADPEAYRNSRPDSYPRPDAMGNVGHRRHLLSFALCPASIDGGAGHQSLPSGYDGRVVQAGWGAGH